ncbi:trypsin-like peptidase domain-containing protein [Candidatus Saccharibacteria bacterium]|nr:trypsin-like peptidase domain-containing protein [Candidatus Saccharibacteria bacterium]
MEKPTINQSLLLVKKLLSSIAIVGLCLVSGVVGSWLYIDSGLFVHQTPKTTELQRVIAEGEVVTDIAKQVSPSVVSIVFDVPSATSSLFSGIDYEQGAGTGIIISKDGYVLTNKHVVPIGATRIKVIANDGTTYESVSIVGRDPVNDLAFLKIKDVSNLTPAKLGDSSQLVVGGKVVAIGNALGEFQTTVTSGIVSGVNRSITAGDATESENLSNLIQTDAAINPGNSGGPLVNINGEVIGINTAISQGAEGIGFAIPINEAKGLIKGVIANGTVDRGYLGVRYIMLNVEAAKHYKLSRSKGAFVTGSGSASAVLPGSPAERAGLKEGDIITRVNDTELSETISLVSLLAQYGPGDSVKLTVVHDGKERTVTVKLERYN